MKSDEWFIEKCLGLEIGESAPPVFRYADGWYVLWDNPEPNNLGRFIANEADLRRILSGSRYAGRKIDLKFISEMR